MLRENSSRLIIESDYALEVSNRDNDVLIGVQWMPGGSASRITLLLTPDQTQRLIRLLEEQLTPLDI